MQTVERIISNPNLAPLSADQLRKHAPSVFSTTAHADVSSRYGFASTAQVLTAMESEGFVPVEVRTYMRRNAADAQFTKHLLRLRRAGDVRKQVVGEVVPQVVLLNSHDRSSLLQLYAGMFRMVCSNGLIVATKDVIEPVRVRHTNRVVEEVMANVSRIAADAGRVVGLIEDMQRVALTAKQQAKFATDALLLRCSRPDQRGAINAKDLLTARREADQGDSVWKVYNRVQENLIKGGVASVTALGRNTHTQPVVGINGDLSINGGLWSLAMEAVAKRKGK